MVAVLPWNHGSPAAAATAEVVHIFGDRAQG